MLLDVRGVKWSHDLKVSYPQLLMKQTHKDSKPITVSTAQGERDHQEDRSVHLRIDLPPIPYGTGWLLAVFDGHRGATTAEKASQSLPAMFETHLRAQRGDIPGTFRDVFSSLNKMATGQISGSTASMVYIPENAQSVYLAVLGDSPIAILDVKGGVHIGPEHNVRTNLKERVAAEARGGVYQGGYLEDSDLPGIGLQMSRSLGDADLNRVLNREPEIQTVAMGGEGYVLVGTDGLFAPGEGSGPEQLKRILGLIRKGAGAEEVVKDALRRQTGDNVTAIVWRND